MKQDNAITIERVRILYERAFASISTANVGVFVFAYIFRDQIALPELFLWLGYMLVVSLYRYWLVFDYYKSKHDTFDHDKYEKRFAYAAGLVGLGWAFFIVSGINLPSIEYRLYSLLLLTGIAALAVPIFASSIKTIYFYIIPSLILSVPLLLFRGGKDSALGLAFIVFTIMVIRVSKDIYNTLRNTLILRFETQEQAENLKKLSYEKSKAEQVMQGIMDNSPAVIYVKDIDGKFIFVNKEYLKLFNLPREKVIGMTLYDIFPKKIADEMRANDIEVQKAKKSLKYEETAPYDDGPHHYISIKFPLLDKEGEIYAVGGVSTDITERQKIEEELRLSQKMDALGKLTGGVAHDYNNMLGVILGYAELLQSLLGEQPELYKYAEAIYQAGERGAKLTNKLLSFSRQQQSDEEVINLNTTLKNEHHLLEKILTARIKLNFELADDLWSVYLDESDLGDTILNISINAMHAIESNGELTFETHNKIVNDADSKLMQVKPGEYVVLSITDTGCGMDKEIIEKIFEPFFSTKGEHGTGLGLSQVYGFVVRSGGTVKVDSEPERGTHITLYFPRYNGIQFEKTSLNTNNKADFRGKETILVVDDEDALLNLTSELLSKQGYHVFKAKDAQQALVMLENESIDLLLSDVIMPDMDGYKLSSIVQEKYPHIKIQLASGFNDDRHLNINDDSLHKNLLHKPFKSNVLFKRVRELLG